MAQMTKNQRIQAALRGDAVDRVPISFWNHFPEKDERVEDLVDVTVNFVNEYDVDLVKLMPTGMYAVIDYGVEVELRPDEIGTTQLKTSPIQAAGDWKNLPAASPSSGVLADQVEVVRRVRAELGPDIPIIQTVFSPLTMAHKMVGDELYNYIESNEAELQHALEQFANDVISFGNACLDAGADGFFFASQHANRNAPISYDAFERLGVAWDTHVLGKLATDGRNWFTMLHLHGLNAKFELADRYPVHAVNWHDRESEPSIKEALGRTSRCLAAGLERKGAIAGTDIDAAIREVDDAIAQANGRRLIIAPGCVVPWAAPPATLKAIRARVDELSVS